MPGSGAAGGASRIERRRPATAATPSRVKSTMTSRPTFARSSSSGVSAAPFVSRRVTCVTVSDRRPITFFDSDVAHTVPSTAFVGPASVKTRPSASAVAVPTFRKSA